MKEARLTLILFFLSLAPALAFAQSTADLNKAVNAVCKDNSMRHASVSVCVRNIENGRTVYSYDAQRSLAPASLVKLFTTALGFKTLGATFRFTTTIGYAGTLGQDGTLDGNVYIVGGGDPMLGSYRYRQTQPDSVFAAWQQALLAHGIRKVSGKVCYQASVFDKQYLPDTWQWGDIGNYYASGVSGLNFHENMFFVYFNAGSRVGYPAALDGTLPASLDVNLQSEVMTGAERSGDQVVVYGEPSSYLRVCRGTVPLGSSHFGIRAAMPRPAETCAKLFAAYLRGHGMAVSEAVEEAYATPQGMKEALKYCSNPYYVVAQYTNQTSNNTYAECIYKYLGYQRFGLGSFQNGEKAVEEYFKSLGLETGGVQMVDGSGLSRENRATADFLCRFLEKVSKESYFDQYQQTLGVVGKSGTARTMSMALPAGVTVHVKSGSMQGICSFAGYVERSDGFKYAFSILCNGYDGSGSNARAKLQGIIREIAML